MKKKLSRDRRKLLIELEQLIGYECYNGNIQNWGPGGTWEGEGRSFRYPVTFRDPSGTKIKRHYVDPSVSDKMLMGGYYAFGANQLHIMAALDRVLDHLIKHHGLEI